ncbi:MAG: XRE family transcriptional regulator [Alphaproteobacteria bacterium]|nr:XRE family transcriptional regulator [Alphaproteobacteria bacterium]
MQGPNLEKKKGKVDSIDQQVGKRLHMRRQMLGLSRQELSDAVNVSVQQIQKYENATNRISSGKLYTLAKFLYVPLDFFFKDVSSDTQTFALQDEKSKYEVSKDNTDIDLHKLIEGFSKIRDRSIRKKILDLIVTLSP